jgi:hypothetical protein
MPSFTTADGQVAHRFRVALLVGRRVSGQTAGHTFTKARIRSVVRDLMAPLPKWTISIEDDAVAADHR